MKKKSKLPKRSGEILSLNDDRGDATWQYERGPRYGNARKSKAKENHYERKKERRIEKQNHTILINDMYV